MKHLCIREKATSSDWLDAKDSLGHCNTEQGQASAFILAIHLPDGIFQGGRTLILSITVEWGGFAVPLGRTAPLYFGNEQRKQADINFPKLHLTIILKSELPIPNEKAK